MATKNGTPGDDTINGTAKADVIDGLAGDDTIHGRDGADAIRGSQGEDSLFGDGGNDILTGGLDDDRLDGGSGVDFVDYQNNSTGIVADLSFGVDSASTGHDTLVSIENIYGSAYAGPDRYLGHHDDITGSSAQNEIHGFAGDDFIVGSGGQTGTTESDVLYGGAGDDDIRGDGEEATVTTSTAGDTIYGELGDDDIYGQAGNDRIFGGAGTDLISGGFGNDVITGAADGDRFSYVADEDLEEYGGGDFGADLITDFKKGADHILFGVDRGEDSIHGFADLDSNHNGVLDKGDEHVELKSVKFEGATKMSTVIDVTALVDDYPGADSLTVFGVTGLKAADFEVG